MDMELPTLLFPKKQNDKESTHHPDLFPEVVIGGAQVANEMFSARFSEICRKQPFCLLYVCFHLKEKMIFVKLLPDDVNESSSSHLLLLLPDEVRNPRHFYCHRLLCRCHVTLCSSSSSSKSSSSYFYLVHQMTKGSSQKLKS